MNLRKEEREALLLAAEMVEAAAAIFARVSKDMTEEQRWNGQEDVNAAAVSLQSMTKAEAGGVGVFMTTRFKALI